MNKTKALVPLQGGALRRRSRGARPSIIGRSRLPGVRLRILFVLVSLVMPLTNVGATPQDEQFQQIAHDYIEGYLTTHPENATELGDHRLDHKLTDYSAEARVQELARAKQTRQQLEGLTDLSQLTGANKVDLRLLKDKVDNELFDIEELKEWEWNPLVYNQSLANSVYLLVARDFAPAEQRILNLRKRLERIPAVIAQAKTNLKHSPKIHLSMKEIMQRAQADLAQTQKAIYETALPLYKKYFPNAGKAALGDKKKVTAAVLDKLAEQHPDDNTIVGYAQKIVCAATDFTKQHDV